MKKFKFSLQVLLRVKEKKKKETEKLFMIKLNTLEAESTLLKEIQKQKGLLLCDIKKEIAQGTKLSKIKILNSYQNILDMKIDEQKVKINKIEEEANKLKNIIIDLTNEIDILNQMKEKQYKKYLVEEQRAQEILMEQIVNNRLVYGGEING